MDPVARIAELLASIFHRGALGRCDGLRITVWDRFCRMGVTIRRGSVAFALFFAAHPEPGGLWVLL